MAKREVRYSFTNTSDEDIFISGVNITIPAGETKVFTPYEIDDIEEYFEYPEVKSGAIVIQTEGGITPVFTDYGTVAFTEGQSSKAVTFANPMQTVGYGISLTPDTNVNVYYTNKTVNGFTINLSAAPGAGETYNVTYIVVEK